MSSIKTTQIDGDIAVGRNVAMGGKLDVAGSATIGHNLKVDGWLEAANIKGANKGIFLTVEELREAYPTPHDGWMAGVGASTPFTAYVGKGGDWVATGGTIDINVDMTQYSEDVAQLQQDVIAATTGVSQNAADITNLRTDLRTAVEKEQTDIAAEAAARTSADTALQAAIDKTDLALSNAQVALGQQISAVATRVTTAEGQIAENGTQIAANKEQLNTVQTAAEQNAADLKSFIATKDEPNGIAPLDEDCLVPNENLHDDVFGVLPFDVTVSGVYADGTLSGESGDGVAYDAKVKRFYAYTQQDGSEQPERYYKYWRGDTHYNDNNSTPYTDKLYLNTATHTVYQWNGSGLVALTSRHLVLTQAEYDALAEAGTLEDDVYYNVIEE